MRQVVDSDHASVVQINKDRHLLAELKHRQISRLTQWGWLPQRQVAAEASCRRGRLPQRQVAAEAGCRGDRLPQSDAAGLGNSADTSAASGVPQINLLGANCPIVGRT